MAFLGERSMTIRSFVEEKNAFENVQKVYAIFKVIHQI
jgi:hypothetical protein